MHIECNELRSWALPTVPRLTVACGLALFALIPATSRADDPVLTVDLATVGEADGVLTRVYGAQNQGNLGVPVATGSDVDGDGHMDYGVAFFQADPFGRRNAGQVDLVFGDGTIGGFIDTAELDSRVLQIIGTQLEETVGSEIWIDDVTGDGLGDLLICRQNYDPGGRLGAGALTIVPGSSALRDLAAEPTKVDLRDPPATWNATTFIGPQLYGRFGIWVRAGDVDGDGVRDLVVGADQIGTDAEPHHGDVWVIRGGTHLASGETYDLVDFGTAEQWPEVLRSGVARLVPPTGSAEFHFGSTTTIADLDGNGRGEVLVAAALSRGGAFLPPAGVPNGIYHSTGGPPNGRLFIAWDDNFPAAPWPVGYTVDLDDPPGSQTVLRGVAGNVKFGEELLGGRDYDGDGRADLFVGDIAGDGSLFPNRAGNAAAKNGPTSGLGHVFFGVAGLKGLDVDLTSLPASVPMTTIFGPVPTALGGDTAADGDFDGDGVDDLAFTAPHDTPQGRSNAGSVFVLYGQEAGWPSVVDTADGQLPPASEVRIVEIQGANGSVGNDIGDTLGYSAAAGDVDGDGKLDLVVNEMVGNGLAPTARDVGNLVVISGNAFDPSPETCPATAHCLRDGRFQVVVDFDGGQSQATPVGPRDASDDSGLFWFFSADNWELLVKVLDGCSINDRFWIYTAAVTDVAYTLRVTDLESGLVREYENAQGQAAPAVTDIDAFDACP